MKALLHSVYTQPDADWVRAQHQQMLDTLEQHLPAVHAHLDGAREEVLTFTGFPQEVWKNVWSNNPNERLYREIRRRTDIVGIFPDRPSVICLVGAVLAEQHDEWSESGRHMNLESLASTDTLWEAAADTSDEPSDSVAISA